jgi:hypothetical protein
MKTNRLIVALVVASLSIFPACAGKPLIVVAGQTRQLPAARRLDLTTSAATASLNLPLGTAPTIATTSYADQTIKQDCPNILRFGGDATGATSSDAAFALLAGQTTGRICIRMPAGLYKFAAPLSVTLSNALVNGSISIIGDGPDVTRLDFFNGTSGLALTVNLPSQSIHVKDLSILAGTFNTSTIGLSLTQAQVTYANSAITAPSDVTNVSIYGNDGYYPSAKGFGIGISVLSLSNLSFNGGYINGPAVVVGSTCVKLSGTPTNIGVVYNFNNAIMNVCDVGLYYGADVQGVSVIASNFTGDNIGLLVPAGIIGSAQLSVVNSQYNTYTSAIDLRTDPGGVTIANNFFYVNGATGGGNAINIWQSQNTNIYGNVFQGIGSNNNGIQMGTYNRYASIIANNNFLNFTTAIWLKTGSQKVFVGPNVFTSVTNNILNLGTNNTIPVTCAAGKPTADFAVVAGIVTAC